MFSFNSLIVKANIDNDVLLTFSSDYQILLHVFTDGEDNATDEEIKKKLEKNVNIEENKNSLMHRFYYSFSDFELVFSLF
jgi:hypothetical protein